MSTKENYRKMVWFRNHKQTNPQFKNIKKEIFTINSQIGHLHELKDFCRSFRYKPKPFGHQQCLKCKNWTFQQNLLREQRSQLMNQLNN